MYTVPLEDLMQMTAVLPHEELLAQGVVVAWTLQGFWGFWGFGGFGGFRALGF